jgi:hypothetical protein
MAAANWTWGEERIAAELLLKLGIRVSPRTVRRYMSRGAGRGGRARSQTWRTFIQNHARAVLACDFFVAVTLRFQLVYVFGVFGGGEPTDPPLESDRGADRRVDPPTTATGDAR